ncbi:MAG: hypothetical protein DHS20C14_03140 [Phycisphaeraceae bacterium]|nr:MAG: hypothetical protein DHS20C14_03140 [Phycisphaeraceae bacterium]
MASNVNIKFVVILTGVLLAISIVVGVTAAMAKFKSADEFESLGDRAMEAGEYGDARMYYSKAVNKEQNNVGRLRKWLDAVEHWEPATETEYNSGFQRTFMLVHRGIAQADTLNPQTQSEFIDLLRAQLRMGQYSRQAADGMIEVANDAIEPFENSTNPPEGWETLRRYRGFAIEQIVANSGVVEPEMRQQALDDLHAALDANPRDGEALAALVRLRMVEAGNLYAQDLPEEADAVQAEVLAFVTAYAERSPDEPWGAMFRPLLDFERERARRSYGLLPDEVMEVQRELLPRYRAQFDEAADTLAQHADVLSDQILAPMAQFEGGVNPDVGYPRTRELLDMAIEAQPGNAALMLFAATMAEQAGDDAGALAQFERVAALPDLPMSLEGWLRYPIRRQALISQADLLLRHYMETPDLSDEERAATLARAIELRDTYASQVAADNPALMFVDGLRHVADDKMPEALRQFQQYNELTSSSNPRGVWREGQAAARLNQDGIAERAYERLRELQPTNFNAIVALAETKLRLQKNAAAVSLLERALELSPGNVAILERLELVRAVENPESADDPIVGAILASRKMRIGNEQTPGDPVGALALLEQGFVDHDYAPLIARELTVVHLEAGDLAKAREVVTRSAQDHADDQALAELQRALEKDTVLDVRLWLVDQRGLPAAEAALAKYAIYTSEGMGDEAAAALVDAAAAAPDDARVVEAIFLQAIRAGDEPGIQRAAARAAELDADRMGGLTFQARYLAWQERYDEAIGLMRQAIDQGAAPNAAYRLLAAQERAAGRGQDAVSTLERALENTPDDITTINEYLAALVNVGRLDDALGAARRSEIYGRANPAFIDAWLNLEALAGGDAGRSLATQRRERMLESRPDDVTNKARLASLYIDARRWDEARALIDELSAERDSLGVVALLATWYADQGRVEVNGIVRNGMDLARSAFTDHIVRIPEEEMTATPWMTMASFLADRGDLPNALLALEEATPLQTDAREVDKMLGDLLLARGRFAEARDAYQRIVDAGADDARQTFLQRLIETHLRVGAYNDADAALAQLQGPAATSQTAILQRAEAAGGRGDGRLAMDLLNQAVNTHPDQPLPYTLRARTVLAQGGLTQDALADLDNALKLDPTFTRARRMRAGIYFRDGRTEDALRDLREVVRQDPSLTEVAFALVEEFLTLGRERDALNVTDEIIRRRPQDTRAMLGFGSIYGRHELWTRASALYQTAWDRSKNPSVAARMIDSLLHEPRPRIARAREVLAEIREIVPESDTIPGVIALDASIAEADGKHADAVRLMGEAFEFAKTTPNTVFTWSTNFSQVFREQTPAELVSTMRTLRAGAKDAEGARWLDLLIARRLVSEEPTRAEGMGELTKLRDAKADDIVALICFQTEGATHYAAERNGEARAVWAAGLEQFPTDSEMANNLAFLLVDRLDDADGALDYALAAVQNAGGRSAMHDTLATVYIALGRLDEAAQALDTAEQLARTPQDRLDVMINRARLSIAQGQGDRARAMLSDALEATVPLGEDRERYQTKIEDLLSEISSPGG